MGDEYLRLRELQVRKQQLFGFLVLMQLGYHGNEGLEVKSMGIMALLRCRRREPLAN